MSLLAHGGQIAANATESRRSVLAAKGSGDLLLDFDLWWLLPSKVVRKEW
jgi:hypothetical protein